MLVCTQNPTYENRCDICGEVVEFDDKISVEIQQEFHKKRLDFHKECLKDTKVLDLLCHSVLPDGRIEVNRNS